MMTDRLKQVVTDEMVQAACAAVILGEDEEYRPVNLEPREARLAIETALSVSWRPISEADKGIAYVHDMGGLRIGNSYPIWARDADGRVFECLWADDGKRAYWWDIEGESPVDPVEFMPHPLSVLAKAEGK